MRKVGAKTQVFSFSYLFFLLFVFSFLPSSLFFPFFLFDLFDDRLTRIGA